MLFRFPGPARISLDGEDAILTYANSSVRIIGGADGSVISELRFDGRAPIAFVDQFNRVFGDGFEL